MENINIIKLSNEKKYNKFYLTKEVMQTATRYEIFTEDSDRFKSLRSHYEVLDIYNNFDDIKQALYNIYVKAYNEGKDVTLSRSYVIIKNKTSKNYTRITKELALQKIKDLDLEFIEETDSYIKSKIKTTTVYISFRLNTDQVFITYSSKSYKPSSEKVLFNSLEKKIIKDNNNIINYTYGWRPEAYGLNYCASILNTPEKLNELFKLYYWKSEDFHFEYGVQKKILEINPLLITKINNLHPDFKKK